MERKINEVFVEHSTLRRVQVVKGTTNSCEGCLYLDEDEKCTSPMEAGYCSRWNRSDKNSVIFKELKGGDNGEEAW